MDAERERRLFVGGITKQIDETIMKEYFSQYGEVQECLIVLNKFTRQRRRFGFVTFVELSVAKKVLQENHSISGHKIDVSISLPKPDSERIQITQGDHHHQLHDQYVVKKIFVGGLPHDLTDEDFKSYFEVFGAIDKAAIAHDKQTNTTRGFGFITFKSDDAVEVVLQKQREKFHELKDKRVEVKRALANVDWKYGPIVMNTYDCEKVRLEFGGGFPYDDLVNGVDRMFCSYCDGAYGYGHYQWCLYGTDPYYGDWSTVKRVVPSWYDYGEVDHQSAWNSYFTYLQPNKLADHAVPAQA